MRKILLLVLLLYSIDQLAQGTYRGRTPNAVNGYLVQLQPEEDLNAWIEAQNKKNNTSFYLDKIISEKEKILLLQHIRGKHTLDMIQQLQASQSIRYAQFNRRVQLRNQEPNDPFWDGQRNLHRIGALSPWSVSNFGKTNSGFPILIGILEPNGFDTEHEDLKGQIWHNQVEIPLDGIDNDQNGFIDDYQGWNASYQNDDHQEYPKHGTEVAGIASASSNNDQGIASVGWNTQLLLLSGSRYESEVIENYDYALQLRQQFNETGGKEGAFIVATNASFGLSGDPRNFPLWCEMYDRLGTEGILSVAAAANRPINTDLRSDMPISCTSDYLITVTGVDEFDRFINSNAYGPETVDIAAPAVRIFTTHPNNNYVEIEFPGNSYAAPHISGAIGLLYSLPYDEIETEALSDPAGTALLMKSFLLKGVDKRPSLAGKIKSEGRIDLQQTHQLIHQHFKNSSTAIQINKIYPNPFSSGVQLELLLPERGMYKIRLLNAQGQSVYQSTYLAELSGLQNFQMELPVHLGTGIYALQLTGAGTTVSTKLLKFNN